MWYAGIDWADTHHDVVVIDEGAKPRRYSRESRCSLRKACRSAGIALIAVLHTSLVQTRSSAGDQV